ncbi:MAG: hypothetical protein BWZ10_02185 [candidate division BRC1 bacterium ADurb.BinA364]|nr:MAG: hypothetical protein BWZ10_02185 [candidate division BRC1 bacterium ADurb.BinA364]
MSLNRRRPLPSSLPSRKSRRISWRIASQSSGVQIKSSAINQRKRAISSAESLLWFTYGPLPLMFMVSNCRSRGEGVPSHVPWQAFISANPSPRSHSLTWFRLAANFSNSVFDRRSPGCTPQMRFSVRCVAVFELTSIMIFRSYLTCDDISSLPASAQA